MSLHPELLFSAERVRGVVRRIKDMLRGRPQPAMLESLPTLSGDPFATLKSDVSKAKADLDKRADDAAAEMKLAMAAATLRDARYGSAGRTQLGRLALNNQIRGAFECAKVVKDHKIS